MRSPKVVCEICGVTYRAGALVPVEMVRQPLASVLHQQYPNCDPNGYICWRDLNALRTSFVRDILETERGELAVLEENLARTLQEHEIQARDINQQFKQTRSFGDRVADKVAEFGGSWAFIISFGVVLFSWIGVNVAMLSRAFDPFPFIFLNLILSCVAAIQAPVIMMSQNRQEDRDRLRSENDYRTNLKAELEIRHLHDKMDFLLEHLWPQLLEIQEVQLEDSRLHSNKAVHQSMPTPQQDNTPHTTD